MIKLAIKNRLAVATLLFLLNVFFVLPLAAQTHTVWSIGKFDYSSGEFRSQNIDYTDAKSDPIFEVGKNEDKDFYRFQPGPANGIAGGRLHPFTIRFNLDQSPRGVYYLKIGILYETPRLPFLNIKLNSHSGNFYFHPKLDFKAGDWEGTFVPQTSYDQKTIAIPATWLNKGANELVLTAVDVPAASFTALGAIAPGQTGLVYDALELQEGAARQDVSKAFDVKIIPSIFYRNSQKGVNEVVDVFISASHWPKASSAELTIAGRKYTKQVTEADDFGERHFEFEIPEWSGEASASLKVDGEALKPTNIAPAKKWNLAIIPHEHLDVGFTDYAAKVSELHSQSIDSAMGLISKTPDFRWTLDGSWVAEQYFNGRSPEAQERFIEHVRDGSIVIPPEFSNQHTGNASWEALARSLYYRRQLEKRFNFKRAEAAQIVDVPSYTWGYASVLHDSGIKYFVAASNSWRAPIMLHGRWNEKSPFYWEGPDGGRVLMWYSRAYLQGHTLFGSPWSMEAVRDALPVFLQAYTRPDYTASTAIIFGTQLENTPLAKEQSEIVARVSSEFAYPKIEYATVDSAMRRIESEWKGSIPVYRGDFGPYWEDGYGSQAQFTAVHRENQHRITTAEAMGAAASSIDPLVHSDRTLLGDAWHNELVFDEHTWTYVGATTQPEHRETEEQLALKGARVNRARNDIAESIQRSWAQLEVFVKPKDASVIVFNALNWPRSGLVETDLPDGSTLADSTTGKEIPVYLVFKGKGIPLPGFGPGSVRVRFVASNVPAAGYKLYTVKPAAKNPENSEIHGNVIENQFYRITVDSPTGAIASIFDKQLSRELVDVSSPYKFGEYLYVSGGDEYPNNSLYRFGAALKPPTLTVHPGAWGKVLSAKSTAIGTVITLSSTATNTPAITTEITLLNSEKKILLNYRLAKKKVLTRESSYIAFPFAVANPEFGYGSQSAWVNPAKNELPGGSREWYLPTTWSAVHNQQFTAAVVALDAPLISLGDIVRASWPTEFKPKSSGIFSWLMNNYWGTNFPAWQGGDEFVFRYAITSDAKFDPSALNRFGWSALTPLEHDDIAAATEPSPLPNTEATLLDIQAPNTTLLTWKEAEDAEGTILRIQENSGTPGNVAISSNFLKIEQAWLCDALEENQSEVTIKPSGINVPIRPFQTLTIRIKTSPINSKSPAKGHK